MKFFKKLIITAVLCCIMVLGETVLIDLWNNPSYSGTLLKKMLIISIRKEPVQRRIWEDAFVGELSKYGVHATSSYHLFPEVLPDTDQVIDIIREKGFDGVLLTRLIPAATKTKYFKSSYTPDQELRYKVFRNRYDEYSREVQLPEYPGYGNIGYRGIDVWIIAEEERMIWSATSYSPERNSVQAVQNDIAELVLPELSRNAILKSER